MLSARAQEIIHNEKGEPYCVKNEIIVKFRPNLLNKSVIDNIEKQTGSLAEFIDPQILALISSSGYFDATIANLNTEKVFRKLTTTDTISISRSGSQVRMPKLWSVLLIHWQESGRSMDFFQAIEKLNKLQPYIVYAEPNFVGSITAVPNDTLYAAWQSSLHEIPNQSSARGHVNVEPAWDITDGNNSVKVGVYDTGILWNHEDFLINPSGSPLAAPFANSRVIGGWDWINNNHPSVDPEHDLRGHGTEMASIIGAVKDNNRGVAGIAGGGSSGLGVQLFSMKVCDGNGCREGILADAIVEGASFIPATTNPPKPAFGYGLHILNMSLSFIADFNGKYDRIKLLEDACKVAFEHEVSMSASAGNDDDIVREQWPADYADAWVMKVSGSNQDGEASKNCTIGGNMDFAAPNYRTEAATIGLLHNSYDSTNGTSSSAAHVSGAAALMLSYKPNLAPEDIEKLLERSAIDALPVGYDIRTGFGKIDIGNAINSIRTPRFDVKHYSATFGQHNKQVFATNTITLVEPYGSIGSAGQYIADVFKVDLTIDITQLAGKNIIDVWKRTAKSDAVGPSNAISGLRNFELVSFNQTQAKVRGTVFHIKKTLLGQTVDQWIPETGLDANAKMEISVYTEDRNSTKTLSVSINDTYARIIPNPSEGNFKILFMLEKDTNLGIQVIDLNGKIVYSIPSMFQVEGHKEIELDLKHLPKGIYVCNLLTNENIVSKKIVIQ
jgi:subtilisin family serine protease